MAVLRGDSRPVRCLLEALLEGRRIHQEVGQLPVDMLEGTLVVVCKMALLLRVRQERRVHLEEGRGTQLEEAGTEKPVMRRLVDELLQIENELNLRSVVVDPPSAQVQEGHRLQLSVPQPLRGVLLVSFLSLLASQS